MKLNYTLDKYQPEQEAVDPITPQTKVSMQNTITNALAAKLQNGQPAEANSMPTGQGFSNVEGAM